MPMRCVSAAQKKVREMQELENQIHQHSQATPQQWRDGSLLSATDRMPSVGAVKPLAQNDFESVASGGQVMVCSVFSTWGAPVVVSFAELLYCPSLPFLIRQKRTYTWKCQPPWSFSLHGTHPTSVDPPPRGAPLVVHCALVHCIVVVCALCAQFNTCL